MNPSDMLNDLYEQAMALYDEGGQIPAMEKQYRNDCQIIVEGQATNRGVLAVLITLLLKKIVEPDQDIRLHQTRMDGGFSGRGLDTAVVTPFLRDMSFPHMAAGSGWLTRSLEQPLPYNLDYPGRIRPAKVKEAFLSLVDGVQCQDLSAENVLLCIFIGLIQFRDRNTNLDLSKPINLSVAQAVEKINQHHSAQVQGAARLPVLAVHAILDILTKELDRYEGCQVLPLEHHTAADSRTDLIGDVHIVDSDGIMFEGYEIKHNIPITSRMIQDAYDKFRATSVRRFYILTTHDRGDYSEFAPDIRRVAVSHGCQLILNGVDQTLLYYLRLVRDTREFIYQYVSNLETDPSVSFQLKESWNQIAQA